ncbi:MAG: flagellar type III secretion system pore protein FliP [Gemmatimonadetes bacterium]|nr:flagellar type III secretion system pore protein FliP [Gemmatimonadota bacterium]
MIVRHTRAILIALVIAALFALFVAFVPEAEASPGLSIELNNEEQPLDLSTAVKIVSFLTILTLAPALVILGTSFTRIVIVFSFLKQAIGQPQSPPNQILVGLALFLTAFVMTPVWLQVKEQAIDPAARGEIEESEAWSRSVAPVRDFMLSNVRERDLTFFLNLQKIPMPQTREEVPMSILVPAFVISEISIAFQIGFLLFIPFVVIDMIVASVLMSMGMMMLPPVIISMPFKILLFILVDGWHLVTSSLVSSFG